MRRSVAAGVGLVAAMGARSALAGLAADADTVVERYSASANVVRLAPRLLGSGPPSPVTLPLGATFSVEPGCTTVVALGAVSTAFAFIAPAEGGGDDSPGQVVASAAGLAQISRCGASRSDLAELSLEVRSPHAVIELVVATSATPLRPARDELRHRDPGLVLPLQRPGPPPSPGPTTERVLALENRLVREAVTGVERKLGKADASGSGRLLMELAAGCHRLTVFATPSGPGDDGFRDVDAELDWASGGMAATDRTESPDAAMTACNAERELGILSFTGAAKDGSVLVVHAWNDMPRSLPVRWGAAAARVARSLLERRIMPPESSPVYESLGVAGITVLPVEVEPGRCYLGAVAPLQGSVKLLALRATTGEVASLAHVDDDDVAAVVTFCAGVSPRGTLEVEAHGGSPILIAGLWPLGTRRLGEETP